MKQKNFDRTYFHMLEIFWLCYVMCFVCVTVVEPPELTYLEYELTAVSDVAQDAEDGDGGEGSKDKLLTVEKRPLMVTMRSALYKNVGYSLSFKNKSFFEMLSCDLQHLRKLKSEWTEFTKLVVCGRCDGLFQICVRLAEVVTDRILLCSNRLQVKEGHKLNYETVCLCILKQFFHGCRVFRLPDGVCFCEEPQVVRFDHTNKVWRTDGFTDKIYNEC